MEVQNTQKSRFFFKKKKDKVGGLTLPNLKPCKVTENKTV